MRGFAVAASLVLLLSAAPTYAQNPPAAAQKPTPTPAPAAQAPAPTPAPQPPAPFPQGAKVAFVNFQRVVAESNEGKASTARVNALIQKKQTEGQDKAKKLQADQQKLQTQGSVMSDAARTQLEKDVEREQVEGQRFQQDAQAEVQELQNELEAEFIKKITPILGQVAGDHGLQMLFNAQQAGFAWVDPGLDLTNDVIKKLDGSAPKTGAPK
jgi:Skp family chaperone for outer membrane proteins